jgi:hypothetical protein
VEEEMTDASIQATGLRPAPQLGAKRQSMRERGFAFPFSRWREKVPKADERGTSE